MATKKGSKNLVSVSLSDDALKNLDCYAHYMGLSRSSALNSLLITGFKPVCDEKENPTAKELLSDCFIVG